MPSHEHWAKGTDGNSYPLGQPSGKAMLLVVREGWFVGARVAGEL